MPRRSNVFLLIAMSASAAAMGATYPQPLPTGFSPASGPPGTVITVTGSGFTGLTQVWIGNAHDAPLQVLNDSTVKVTVPADATTAHLGFINPQNSDFTPDNFTVTTSGVAPGTVSGAVVGPTATSVHLTGTSTNATSGLSGGRYSFSGVANGGYTVTPRMHGYVFIPTAAAAVVAGEAVSGATFTGTSTSSPTYTLSGTISGADGNQAIVTLNGANLGSATTDVGGTYSFSGLAAGTYTVSASHAGTTFSQSRTVTLSNVDSTENNFTAVDTAGGKIDLAVVRTLPQASVGKPYSASVVQSISGGNGKYRYQTGPFGSGNPPLGMILNPDGTLTGTPLTTSQHTFLVCAADTAGNFTAPCATTSITVGSGSTPPPGTSWVYYNGVFDWPGDYSFVGTPDYSDTSGGPISGPYDIKFTLQSAWGGWLPYAKNWDFNSSGYTKLTFALKPTVDNQTWSVYFVKVGDVPVGIYLDVSNYGPAPVKGQWATYTVPLAALGVLGTDIYKFCIQDQTGLSSNYWYIDNVGFAP
jgi:hypothetical protein